MNEIRACRLAAGFDVVSLGRGLGSVAADEWRRILDEEGWSSWTGVALRSADGGVRTLVEGDAYAETDLVRREPAYRALLSYFQCPLRRVRILRLAAGGGTIHEHCDDMPPGPPLARLQIPIVGAEHTDFTSEGRKVPMRVGELWYVDVTRPHAVVNRGTVDRTSVVIDCELNPWLRGMILAGALRLTAPEPVVAPRV